MARWMRLTEFEKVCRERHWQWWKFLICLVLALIFAFSAERLYTMRNMISEAVAVSKYGAKFATITQSDVTTKDYDIKNGVLVSKSGDPYLVGPNMGYYVDNVVIRFSQPIKQDTTVAVYFAQHAQDFTLGNKVECVAAAGATEIRMPVKAFASCLRFDLGTVSGQEFALKSIAVNDSVVTWSTLLGNLLNKVSFDRLQIFFVLFALIGLYFIIGWKTMNRFLFRFRWIFAGCLLLFLVLNQYNTSSVGMYDTFIQSGLGGDHIAPVLGTPRPIRSDEWIVNTPNLLSAKYAGFGYYNDIPRGTETPNIAVSGLYLSFSSLAYVSKLAFYGFGMEYGLSFATYLPIILNFMVALEFFYILTKKNPFFAVMGGSLVGLSPYIFWWSTPMYICCALAIWVCVYYFLHANRLYVKILCGVGATLAGANYVATIYPGWLVPCSYLLLGLLVWLVISSWDRIKRLRFADYCIFLGGLVLMAAIIIAFLKDSGDYFQALTSTEYPGAVASRGGYTLNKIFIYPAMGIFPYQSIGNASELSTMITFFPLPLIMLVYQIIRRKRADSLSVILLTLTVFIGTFVTTGWPGWLADATFMKLSEARRCVDIFVLLQVIVLITVVSRFRDVSKWPWYVGVPISIGTVVLAYWQYFTNFVDPIPKWFVAVIGAIFILYCITFTTRLPDGKLFEKFKSGAAVALIAVSIASTATVFPVMKGLDVMYSKPVAQKIQQIVEKDPNSIWIGMTLGISPYIVANGGRTITSVNIVPNMALWRKLDPQGNYNSVYNRYAHISVTFTDDDTWFELASTDYMILHLNYKDLALTGCKYIFSQSVLEGKQGVKFDEIYNEAGCIIYKVDYSSVSLTVS